MKNIIVTGSESGLGKAICQAMKHSHDLVPWRIDISYGKAHDVSNEQSIKGIIKKIKQHDIHGIINCAGVNHIDWIENISSDDWDRVMNTNAKSIWLMTKHFLPKLIITKGVIVNVVSNACRMPMTNSIVYNASKGAAEIMTKQMARELTKKYGITVFGINPNKLEGTGMSKYIEKRVVELRGWTPEYAREYQKKGLLAGFETKPEWIAELLVWLLEKDHRHQYLTGCLLDLGL